MDAYKVVLSPTTKWTRVLVTLGPDELLRAILPPPAHTRHERAVAMFLEALALWLDVTLPVVLSVAAREASCCLGLTDELGVGARSIFYRVDVVTPEDHRRRRGQRRRGLGGFGDLRQLRLLRDDEAR